MKLEDVKKLAEMSRIDMSDTEMEEIANDFDPILAYVDQIKEASQIIENKEFSKEEPSISNIMREDEVLNEPGFFSEKIIDNMPDVENNFLKVKQIL
jgi:aspartyl-tRNA(Asn)/glutamyl-tRNA(Gln) amidotransferase subunit C